MRQVLVVIALACLAVSAHASTVFSDGFNFTPPATGPFATVNAGGTIGPWTVGSGSVDWITGYWQPAEGNGSVDLSGNTDGSISTILNTVVGQAYTVNFYMAGNPDNPAVGPTIKTLDLQAGSLDETFIFDTTGHTLGSMGWVLETAVFTATSTQTTLTFTSQAGTAYGPALDGVTVTTVPEPATCAFALLGLAGIGLFRRRW